MPPTLTSGTPNRGPFAGAYGKAGNGSGMETGNRKWKWKLETEI